jgi:hypothetical protein
VSYSRFGTWIVQLEVSAAFGQGEGEATFVDNVRPGALNPDPDQEAARKADEERIFKLQLFFGFDWWPDVVNIAMRATHSVSALTYFGLSGMVLFMAWFGAPVARPRLPARVAPIFLPIALASLLGLLATGLYSAAFDAPNTAPGIYDVDGLLNLPYGRVYLVAFLFKPVAWTALVVLAFRISSALRSSAGLRPIGGGAVDAVVDAPTYVDSLKSLTLVNAGVGLLIFMDLTVVIYMHYLSHLGVFLPTV